MRRRLAWKGDLRAYTDGVEKTVQSLIKRGKGGKITGIGFARTSHGTSVGYGSVVTPDLSGWSGICADCQDVVLAKAPVNVGSVAIITVPGSVYRNIPQWNLQKRLSDFSTFGVRLYRIFDVDTYNSQLLDDESGCLRFKEAMARPEFQAINKQDLYKTDRRILVLPRSLTCFTQVRDVPVLHTRIVTSTVFGSEKKVLLPAATILNGQIVVQRGEEDEFTRWIQKTYPSMQMSSTDFFMEVENEEKAVPEKPKGAKKKVIFDEDKDFPNRL
ncbi:unnamed protein product [Nippostrongylus brasiliensis]|uniref:UBX domain-containing protein n=1 Tax=Nippostrongylus brasiliensis TaxID=27835 RepID=A0A0N4YLA1_NIPBR|nr:unnamed protein product [Nippostrongylus brasiliensis]